MNNPDPIANGGLPLPHAGAGAAGVRVPAFLDDPGTCLNVIANRPSSRDFWGMLAGTTASCMKEETNPQLCALYLQAVAQQMPASEGTEAGVAMAAANANNNNSMEQEMVRAQRLLDILDAVGVVATRCRPRLAISQSGILRALLAHPGFKSPYLTQIQVEFCHVALMAEQYRFAARFLHGTWPRPASTISVRHVLRYYLLRGMIHVGCNDWIMAIRCFWTCLSIPSEIVSALGIAAWKKLVLVQCLQMEDDDYQPATSSQSKQQGGYVMAVSSPFGSGNLSSSGRGPLSLPKALPTCFSRFLSMASTNSKQQQRNQPEELLHHAGIMVQEELGEPSSQQQGQQQQQGGRPQQQLQQQQQPYGGMGVHVYMNLVQAFVSGDRTEFLSLQQQHANLLHADDNVGLVRQCEIAMLHRQVYQLSRMFAVIPLTDLAAKLKIESVEHTKELLLKLSMKKTCAGSERKRSKWPNIEVEDDGMVVFNFASTTSVNEQISGVMGDDEMERDLEDNIKELIQLTKEVEKLDVSIATSPMYHALVRRANDAKMSGPPRGVEEL